MEKFLKMSIESIANNIAKNSEEEKSFKVNLSSGLIEDLQGFSSEDIIDIASLVDGTVIKIISMPYSTESMTALHNTMKPEEDLALENG